MGIANRKENKGNELKCKRNKLEFVKDFLDTSSSPVTTMTSLKNCYSLCIIYIKISSRSRSIQPSGSGPFAFLRRNALNSPELDPETRRLPKVDDAPLWHGLQTTSDAGL